MIESILAVDDSKMMRELVAYTLEEAGYINIVSAENGVDALERAKLNKYDLIITDVNMPLMGGLELCKNLRTLELYKDTPIVVLTTESGEKIREEGRIAGASAWIVKPFLPENFLYVIQRVTRKEP